MTTRTKAPDGGPCWADLWTSDVEGSRRFYSRLFGWEAQEPSPEFGGYFLFTRDGVPVAGAMGPMGVEKPSDSWKIYLTTDDIAGTASAAEAGGATVVFPPMPVADSGAQVVLIDPTGAELGVWQPATFPGFTVLDEPGTPSWFELHTRDHARALQFYESVFHWRTDVVGDSDEFRYSTMRNPDGGPELAGVMDAAPFLPDGVGSHWAVYWEVADADAVVTMVKELGGSVEMDATDTPYGRLASVVDPAGARFKLRTAPR